MFHWVLNMLLQNLKKTNRSQVLEVQGVSFSTLSVKKTGEKWPVFQWLPKLPD